MNRPFLKEIKTSSETRILLHCKPKLAVGVLERAKEVGLLGAYQNFFISSLVSTKLLLSHRVYRLCIRENFLRISCGQLQNE